MFTMRPLHRGWLMSNWIRTRRKQPRHSTVEEVSTCSTVPSVLQIASAVSVFILRRGRLCIWTQNDALSNVASSTDSSPKGLYKPIRYLSKVHGPYINNFCGVVSSSKIIKTVLDPKSRTSNVWIDLHILCNVLVRAFRLTVLLVKSFATRMRLLHSTTGGRSIVWFSLAWRDRRAHCFARSSICGVEARQVKGIGRRAKKRDITELPLWEKGSVQRTEIFFINLRFSREPYVRKPL